MLAVPATDLRGGVGHDTRPTPPSSTVRGSVEGEAHLRQVAGHDRSLVSGVWLSVDSLRVTDPPI